MTAILLYSRLGSAQITPAQNKVKAFQVFFDDSLVQPQTSQPRKQDVMDLVRLEEIVPTMTTAELQQTVSIIEAAIEKAQASHDGTTRLWAGMFLSHIAGTKDGPALLVREVSGLSALCSDPFLLAGSFNMFFLLQKQYPELTVPAMLRAIKAPDANSAGGKGPAYATILFLYPSQGDLLKDVFIYMQRPDLAGQKLLDFLNGIRATSLMPNPVVEQLTHYLAAPQPEVRLAALRDISAGGFDERRKLKPMFQRLANDPAQSAAFHSLAVELLDSNKMFSLDPSQ